MLPRWLNILTGLIAIVLVSLFLLGLSHSISTGFAGFWGGLPFMIIAIVVLAFAYYDYWNTCIRRKD